MELSGLNCLVTGGSKGIGKSCVELLASKGAKVSAKQLILLCSTTCHALTEQKMTEYVAGLYMFSKTSRAGRSSEEPDLERL